MSSYCLKCRKNTENINPRVNQKKKSKNQILVIVKQCYYQNKQSVVLKNQDLL